MARREKMALMVGLTTGLLWAAAPVLGAWDFSKAKAFQQIPNTAQAEGKAEKTIAPWPDASQLLARSLLEELGAPDEVMPHYLSWSGRAPFNTITVYSDRDASNQPGVLMQTVSYRVPVGKWRALNAFGHGVSYDVIFNELVACSDAQETNLLALNLADEVIQGRRSPDEARALFDKTVTRSLAGRSSYYLTGLKFDPGTRSKR